MPEILLLCRRQQKLFLLSQPVLFWEPLAMFLFENQVDKGEAAFVSSLELHE